MAKLKKSASKTASRSTKATAAEDSKARQARSISESAQQIWLAGMGAFNRAQAEGSRLFESLVRDGLSLEQTARKFAGTRATVVRGAMESHVGQAKERATDTWDKLEKVFEDRVQRALVKLGVPGRADLQALTDRVERLTAALHQRSAPAPKAAKAAATKPAAKPATRAKAPAKAKSNAAKTPKAAKVRKAAKPETARKVG